MNQIVYVSCAQSHEVRAYQLDKARGELVLCQQLPLPGAATPLGRGANPLVLYTGVRPDNTLLALAIDPRDGQLSVLGSSAVEGGPTYVSTDRAGRMAFSASHGGSCLCVCPLDEQGVPGLMSQYEQGVKHAHAALVDADNRWLYVPALGEDAIRIYRVEEAGVQLHAVVPCRSGSGPRHPVLSNDGKHLWCVNELDGTVDLFNIDQEAGALHAVQSISLMPTDFTGKPWSSELRATPNNRFLYATDRRASVIAAFALESGSGRLSLIGHYPTEEQPRGMAISPDGACLVVAGQQSHQLTLYAIDPQSGKLEARQRIATGQEPIMVEIVALPTKLPTN